MYIIIGPHLDQETYLHNCYLRGDINIQELPTVTSVAFCFVSYQQFLLLEMPY